MVSTWRLVLQQLSRLFPYTPEQHSIFSSLYLQLSQSHFLRSSNQSDPPTFSRIYSKENQKYGCYRPHGCPLPPIDLDLAHHPPPFANSLASAPTLPSSSFSFFASKMKQV